MSIRETLRQFFDYSTGERRGVIVLVIVLMLSLVIRIMLPYLINDKGSTEISVAYLELQKKQNEIEYTKKSKKRFVREKVEQSYKKVEIIPALFDPNTASSAELSQVGFSSFVSVNIVKYRNGGGMFREKTDLFKIYGVDSSHTQLINRYCEISNELIEQKDNRREAFRKQFKVEINTADSVKMVSIPGIGKILSQRILKYREKLGGFSSPEQLKEIYGIQEERFDQIKDYILVDTLKIIKLNINELSAKELSKHPYLNTFQSQAIVKYRELMGVFVDCKQVFENYILTEEEYHRVVIYLAVGG